jgi:signal transduction histidine kinase
VLIERVQSSQGFFSRWRTVVFLSIAGSFLIAFLYNAPIRSIYSLLLTAMLAVAAYAMFNWRQHVERQDFMDRLRPFVASLHLYDHLLSAGESSSWAEARDLFTALCRDVLGTERACLLFNSPMPVPRTSANLPRSEVEGMASQTPGRLDYGGSLEHDAVLSTATLNPTVWTRLDADHWAWPLSDSRGTIGRLILGPKIAGVEYTAQELEVAATCAERILDALAGEQITRVALSLLRRRIAEVQVMSARHKRVLHDDLLPQIHLALLRIEALRQKPADWGARLDETAGALTQMHRQLAALVREMSNAAPTRLESEGLVAALDSALTHDFHDSFDEIHWQANPAAIEHARRLPLFVGEVVFYAAQEAIRNSARHGRGGDPDRKLRLEVDIMCGGVSCDASPGLKIVVGDDGVGRQRETGVSAAGAGSGLLFHSAMLAVIGGALGVSDRAGGGTQVVIGLPQS